VSRSDAMSRETIHHPDGVIQTSLGPSWAY
jgi:hypothetical protein